MEEQQTPKAQTNPAHQPGTGKGEERAKQEGQEAGRKDTDTTGQAERPAGTSTPEASTGVNPKGPVDPQSPHLPTP